MAARCPRGNHAPFATAAGRSLSRHIYTGELYRAYRRMREKFDRARHAGERIGQGGATSSAPDSRHQAQGLDFDLLAAAVEIEEPAGPVLAS